MSDGAASAVQWPIHCDISPTALFLHVCERILQQKIKILQ